MKKLFIVLCLILPLLHNPVLAKPAPKCKTVQKCKVHHMLKGHKVPQQAKKK